MGGVPQEKLRKAVRLHVGGATVQQVATECSIHRVTLHRWKNRPEWAALEAEERARREAVQERQDAAVEAETLGERIDLARRALAFREEVARQLETLAAEHTRALAGDVGVKKTVKTKDEDGGEVKEETIDVPANHAMMMFRNGGAARMLDIVEGRSAAADAEGTADRRFKVRQIRKELRDARDRRDQREAGSAVSG